MSKDINLPKKILMPLRFNADGTVQRIELSLVKLGGVLESLDSPAATWRKAAEIARLFEEKIAAPDDERVSPLTLPDVPPVGLMLDSDEIAPLFNCAFDGNDDATKVQVNRMSKLVSTATNNVWRLSAFRACLSTFNTSVTTVQICEGLVFPLGKNGALTGSRIGLRRLNMVVAAGLAGIAEEALELKNVQVTISQQNQQLRPHGFRLKRFQQNGVWRVRLERGFSKPSHPKWSPEQEALLRQLKAEGLSYSKIAARLGGGMTKNAVCGKMRRFGLSVSGRRRRDPLKYG